MDENSKTVVLTRCNNDFHAHILQGALENAGIPSILQNENSASVALQGMIDSGIQILVFDHDLERAKEILAIDEGGENVDDEK